MNKKEYLQHILEIIFAREGITGWNYSPEELVEVVSSELYEALDEFEQGQ